MIIKTSIELFYSILYNEIKCSTSNLMKARILIEKLVNELISRLEVDREIHVDCVNLKKQETIKCMKSETTKYTIQKLLDYMQGDLEYLSKNADSLAEIRKCGEGNRQEVDLHVRLDRNLAILQERFEAHQNRPNIEIVREYGTIANIEGYEQDIDRVLINILSNAIDAVEESNRGRTYEEIERNPNRIRIKTEINSDRNLAIIKILDNGIGIKEHDKECIFLPFCTRKQLSEFKKHQGIGLFISRYIIEEKHDGQLTCDSTPGEGSEFTIEIPIQPVEP